MSDYPDPDFVLESTIDGVDLVITGNWSARAQAVIESGEANGLVLNYARGFRERHLEFIAGLPIRRLVLLARTIRDLSPVYSIAQTLEDLRVDSAPSAIIDLNRLQGLKVLSADWAQIQASISSLVSLERVFPRAYTERDLLAFEWNTALTHVVMKDRPKIASLNGLEKLPWLSTLSVHLAFELQDFAALSGVASPVLSELQLTSCKAMSDLGVIESCSNLRFLNLSECGDLQSLAPLAALSKLETLHLYGSTRVLDGDLKPLLKLTRLKELRIKSRRSYSPTVSDLQRVIAQRDTS